MRGRRDRGHYRRHVQYVFPACAVLIDEDGRYVETRFEDGAKVGSTPNRDEHSRRVAADLGYGDDTWTMSRDHEVAHSWLEHLDGRPWSRRMWRVARRSHEPLPPDGRPWSRTMWRLAHPYDDDLPDDAEVAEEETRVLEFQRHLDKAQ